jgi:hypothetical protein
LLLPAEITGVLWIRGLPLQEYLRSFLSAPGGVAIVMFLLFAANANLRFPISRRSRQVSRPRIPLSQRSPSAIPDGGDYAAILHLRQPGCDFR